MTLCECGHNKAIHWLIYNGKRVKLVPCKYYNCVCEKFRKLNERGTD